MSDPRESLANMAETLDGPIREATVHAINKLRDVVGGQIVSLPDRMKAAEILKKYLDSYIELVSALAIQYGDENKPGEDDNEPDGRQIVPMFNDPSSQSKVVSPS